MLIDDIVYWHVCVIRALSQMKVRLKGAQKGHSLLKKKADALTLRFRQILSKIIEVSLDLCRYTVTLHVLNVVPCQRA